MSANNDHIEVSILLVSRNRKEALKKTLHILKDYVNRSKHEICVLLDNCSDNSQSLKLDFPDVNWLVSERFLGASKARNILYKTAKGAIFIGLDDDAHPLQNNFISIIEQEFSSAPNAGILAFQEVKGVFSSDLEAKSSVILSENYNCSTFIGCGFAIKKVVYESTNGFPIWIDIYGEEDCLAIEVLANGYDILYVNSVFINHRVDLQSRKNNGYDQFRFGKQLKNTALYYLVYYPNPIVPILKLFWHNCRKYVFKNKYYFLAYCQSFFRVLLFLPKLRLFRNPVDKISIQKKVNLPLPKF